MESTGVSARAPISCATGPSATEGFVCALRLRYAPTGKAVTHKTSRKAAEAAKNSFA